MGNSSGKQTGGLFTDLQRAKEDLEAALTRGDARAVEVLRVRYDALQQRWRATTQEQIEQVRNTAVAPAPPASLSAHLYPFPPSPITSGVGVCLSGGGSRAASASMGELRGLRSLGLLDRVSALSTVSGGSWAGVTFTYLPSDISDDEFLGGVVSSPGDLTWEHHSGEDPARALDTLSHYALGSLCTRIGLVEFLAEVAVLCEKYRDSPHVLWCRAVGALILEPFGLGDITRQGSPATYYSSTQQWLEGTILGDGRNPTLSASDFHLVQKSGRPYLITNSTIFSPPGVHLRRPAPGSPPIEPYPFEASVTGAGVPFPLQGRLGGGTIDPFAFGGQAPAAPPAQNRVQVPTPPQRFSLSDIAGTSSSAFVGPLIQYFYANYPWLEDIDPIYSYWPVMPANQTPAQQYFIGDGGNLENTGLMGLLRRKMTRIIAFVHAPTPLSWDPVAKQVVVDSQLPPLFGLQPKVPGQPYQPYPAPPTPVSPSARPYRFNQVFDQQAFYGLIDQLWQSHQAGGSAICKQARLTVHDNAHFGIQSVGPVDVLWVYTNPVTAWTNQLSDTVRLGMDFEPLLYGTFPNYDTILQLHLEPRQVNLLAHLSCWNVINERPIGGFPANAQLFREMFE
ncbi:MAG TPA: hypothetical protein VJ805_04960 [Nitrospiraceae bacterium]|nr:hypothetical protein [Nitrospiraceae bacterium]